MIRIESAETTRKREALRESHLSFQRKLLFGIRVYAAFYAAAMTVFAGLGIDALVRWMWR